MANPANLVVSDSDASLFSVGCKVFGVEIDSKGSWKLAEGKRVRERGPRIRTDHGYGPEGAMDLYWSTLFLCPSRA